MTIREDVNSRMRHAPLLRHPWWGTQERALPTDRRGFSGPPCDHFDHHHWPLPTSSIAKHWPFILRPTSLLAVLTSFFLSTTCTFVSNLYRYGGLISSELIHEKMRIGYYFDEIDVLRQHVYLADSFEQRNHSIYRDMNSSRLTDCFIFFSLLSCITYLFSRKFYEIEG